MKKNLKTKWLHVRFSDDEHELLLKQFKGTTERKLSAYSRKILLGVPMIKGVRNLDQESVIKEFSGLLKDLNGIANNYNQAVHKLHTLNTQKEMIRWIMIYENDKSNLLSHIEEIRIIIRKVASEWLQS